MLSFGEQLYRLTARDEEGVKLEPFFRSVTGVLIPTASQQVVSFDLPSDRCLYAHALSVQGGLEPNTQWTEYSITSDDVAGVAIATHWRESPGTSTGQAFYRNPQLQLILPPFTRRLSVTFVRTGTTGSANCFARLTGYLLPPGRIARV